MVAGSILPVCFYKNKLFFLFGKENPMEDSSKGWSDFGGANENGETHFETGLREGSEELSGFLGNKENIKKIIHRNGGFYKLSHNDYHVHLFLMDYDENLPIYYNNNHCFLWNKMNKHFLNDSKLFEKIEIDWFSVDDMKKKRSLFRNFYREIVDKIIEDIPNIKRFIKNKKIKQRKTKKNIKSQKKNKTIYGGR